MIAKASTTKKADQADAKQQAVEQAVTDLLDGMLARIRESPRELSFDGLIGEFESRVGRDVGPVRVQAKSIASGYNAQAARALSASLVQLTAGKLGGVLAACDQLLGAWSHEDDLTEARAELRDAEQARDRALAELRDAVDRADIDDVLRLRTEVEVAAPRRVEAALLAVLELELARATDLGERPARRQRLASETLRSAEATHAEAVAVAERAALTLEEARTRHALASRASQLTEAGIAELRRQCDEAKAQAVVSTTERFRRLAGLPSEAAIEPTGEESPAAPQVATNLIEKRTEVVAAADPHRDIATPSGWPTMAPLVIGAPS